MNIALAIFVKTPGVSPVKTRLAASIGTKNAEAFYISSLKVTADIANSLKQIYPTLDIFWAIAENECLNFEIWKEFKVVNQECGSLGSRLANVYNKLKKEYDAVFFIGADAPHIPINYYELGINKLLQKSYKKFVIGNTDDGGFYLFGGKINLPAIAFESVEYSTEKTAQDLCVELAKYGDVDFVKSSFDIDCIKDLEKYKKLNFQSEKLLLSQQALIYWGGNFCEHLSSS